MPLRRYCRLLVLVASCLLWAPAAEGAEGGKTRDLSIPGTRLVLRVPQGVAVNPKKPSPDDTLLWVAVDDLRTFQGDGVVGRDDVLAQRAALAKGEAEVAEGWEEGVPPEVVPLPTGGYAVVYPWYSPFEYCALEFTMNAAFFVDNRRVTLRYSAAPAGITRENPSFFSRKGLDLGCETDTIWNLAEEEDVLLRFDAELKAGRLGPAASAWYADFRGILASLRQASAGRKAAAAPQRK